jgi:hypothetical protein
MPLEKWLLIDFNNFSSFSFLRVRKNVPGLSKDFRWP